MGDEHVMSNNEDDEDAVLNETPPMDEHRLNWFESWAGNAPTILPTPYRRRTGRLD